MYLTKIYHLWMDNSFKVRCLDIKPNYKVKLAGYIQFCDGTKLNDRRLFPALETKTFLGIRLSNLIQLLSECYQ